LLKFEYVICIKCISAGLPFLNCEAGCTILSGAEKDHKSVRLSEMQLRSILKADHKENGTKTFHVSRDNIIPFPETREGSDDACKEQGTHPRREFVDAEEVHTILTQKMADKLSVKQSEHCSIVWKYFWSINFVVLKEFNGDRKVSHFYNFVCDTGDGVEPMTSVTPSYMHENIYEGMCLYTLIYIYIYIFNFLGSGANKNC
jgi:hypothetical protein